ncbi:MAG: hypothetical protein IPM74_15915 [Crocinitomicaceae bacterium]|nr:hypothetical protein [Crocinitomicaceae bacterium]
MWLDAVNEDGYSSESFLKIQLVVYPPFWQRWWFYLVIVLLTGMLAALFYTQIEVYEGKVYSKKIDPVSTANY